MQRAGLCALRLTGLTAAGNKESGDAMPDQTNKSRSDCAKESVRLFTAVELPATVKSLLLSLKTNIPGLKWTGAENLHLTLRFIGEVPAQNLPAIKEALRVVRPPAFPLRLNGLGLFERPYQSILWAGLENRPELISLKRDIDKALSAGAALAPEKGRFSPHITLGRLKDSAPEMLYEFVNKNTAEVRGEFAVASFVLFKSTLEPGGAVHKLEETYPLQGA